MHKAEPTKNTSNRQTNDLKAGGKILRGFSVSAATIDIYSGPVILLMSVKELGAQELRSRLTRNLLGISKKAHPRTFRFHRAQGAQRNFQDLSSIESRKHHAEGYLRPW